MDEFTTYETFTIDNSLVDFKNNYTNSVLISNENSGANISLQDMFGPKRDSLYIIIPITIIYVIIFFTGIVGNISTCVVISRNKSMHTATNYYLFSLAISDLLLLVSGLPQEIYWIWSRYPYIFGQTFCILRGLFSETSANATVLTITAFTVERYMAICHPFLSHTMSKLSRAVKFILIIWMVAIFFAIPQALQFDVKIVIPGLPETETCHVARIIIPHSFEFSTFVFFVGPMSLITILYVLIGLRLRSSNRMKKSSGESRGKNLITTRNGRGSSIRQRQGQSSRRVLKMLVAVVVAFFVCWAPFHTQRLVAIYGTTPRTHEDHEKLMKIYEIVTYFSGILYYLSTTINPLLYNIMSNKFRDAFRETFSRCCGFACIKSQRPQCTYSILSRAHNRGADSHTDSTTGRDDPSVQTHFTLTHKNSQESMSFQSSIRRNSSKRKAQDATEAGNGGYYKPSNYLNRPPISPNAETPERRGKFNKTQLSRMETENRTIKFWHFFVCVVRRSGSDRHISGIYSSPIREPHYNIELETSKKRNLSTSSCDISNSSLRDFDNAVLEDELASYLTMVKCQQ